MSEIRVDLITEKTADGGVTIKSTGTGDNKPTLLTLQTSEADIAANDVLGKIQFQAPDEGTGTDAILVSAAIQARSEGDFAADANATAIDFMVGASEAAATKMSLSSTGVLTAIELDISGNVDVDGTTNLDVVDIDGAVDMASTLQVDGSITSSDGMTITTADNTDTLTLISTDADANAGPNLRLYRNSSSPLNDDVTGVISFDARNDNSQDFISAEIKSISSDDADGSEDGTLGFSVMNAGTLQNVLFLSGPEVIFNELSNDIDFRVESNGNTHAFFVNGGDDSIGLFNSAPAFTTGSGMHLGDEVAIGFGAGGSGRPDFQLRANSTNLKLACGFGSDDTDININTGGKISTGGEQGPDVDAGGLTLNQTSNDGNILTFKSSDVGHGITDHAESDTYFAIKKRGNDGGVFMTALHDQGDQAFRLEAFAVTENAVKGTTGNAPINFQARKKSGTDGGVFGSNANLFCVANNGNTKFIVDAEGELHSDGGAQTAYDSYEDAQLVRAFDLSHGNGVIDSKFDKFISYNHEALADMKLVGREEDGTPNHFINVTGMQRLHNGAIWQQYEKTERLANAFYKLATKTIGKAEADKLLTEEEIQLLN